MNGDVTSRAVARLLKRQSSRPVRHDCLAMESRMALQTDKPCLSPHKHEMVRASVGSVAAHTANDFHGRVFINKWTAHLDVALHARLKIRFIQLMECRQGAMRRVAGRAFHQPFRNRHVEGQGVLRFNVAVALVAEVRLRLEELPVMKPRFLNGQPRNGKKLLLRCLGNFRFGVNQRFDQVRGVAVQARDAPQRVDGLIEELLVGARDVADETVLRIFGRSPVETENQLTRCFFFSDIRPGRLFRHRVRLVRPMASSATINRVNGRTVEKNCHGAFG